jgi:lipoprotein-anchoring transpeptidase ErfK/SrfK
VGAFKILVKLENPVWYKAGAVIPPESPDNVLGTRWMGFDLEGYGIHGTVDPDKIGQQVTSGCIRMRNEEVEELYKIVPRGTPVTVVD